MHKILLVEDCEFHSEILSRRLMRRGFHVVVAVNGLQALELANSIKPDLILMDMGLPIVDGWAATRRLKAAEKTRSISVIALTADAMSGDRGKAIEAGCDEYECKPVELDRLLGKIRALIP